MIQPWTPRQAIQHLEATPRQPGLALTPSYVLCPARYQKSRARCLLQLLARPVQASPGRHALADMHARPGPMARAGASLSITEDGRRLYLFGGHDGTKALNDVHFMEVEKLAWNPLPVHVSPGRAAGRGPALGQLRSQLGGAAGAVGASCCCALVGAAARQGAAPRPRLPSCSLPSQTAPPLLRHSPHSRHPGHPLALNHGPHTLTGP